MVSKINWRSRRVWLVAGLVPALVAVATLWGMAAFGDGGTATATSGHVANKEAAASRAIALATAHDGITTSNAYVEKMTQAEYIERQGGELGMSVEGRDDDVWVVVIEPTEDIVRAETEGEVTYSLFEIAFFKATGRVVSVGHLFDDKYAAVPMTEDFKVAPRD
jgi:F0F1-type ATP synthase alpha subunit